MREWKSGDIGILENGLSRGSTLPEAFLSGAAESVRRFHSRMAGYRKTPLTALPGLAEALGVKNIYVKDESGRFGLNAFKGLGGSFAMFRVLCERLSLDPASVLPEDLEKYRDRIRGTEFATCTDGNHGKGVSWAAGLFGCRAHVFMPRGTREVRAAAVRAAGPADVSVTDLNYDGTVEYAREMSEKNGWILIQDTSADGNEKIPSWIMQGYLTMASEAFEDLDALGVRPTHVFLQAGVGSMAAALLACFLDRWGKERLTSAVVEAEAADCFFRSVKAADGLPRSVGGNPETMMAGLNCGSPCSVAWPVLRDHAGFFISLPDRAAAEGMKLYASGRSGDPRIVSGESGASTLGALAGIMRDGSLSGARSAMGLSGRSVVFLISTEGATDPENYERVTGLSPLRCV